MSDNPAASRARRAGEVKGGPQHAGAVAIERAVARKPWRAMERGRVAKVATAERTRTSRIRLDRLLDPSNTA